MHRPEGRRVCRSAERQPTVRPPGQMSGASCQFLLAAHARPWEQCTKLHVRHVEHPVLAGTISPSMPRDARILGKPILIGFGVVAEGGLTDRSSKKAVALYRGSAP